VQEQIRSKSPREGKAIRTKAYTGYLDNRSKIMMYCGS
jgi:hypothetical protein